ncbi:hypothetical protein UG55_103540 [Frankia sp. EI5c]|nr:hypothetical protein UG55_103540 [Frankia sp. EI5c]
MTTVPIHGTTVSAGEGSHFPSELVEILHRHREKQEEREVVGLLWQDEEWVFAGETGQALIPNTDRCPSRGW